MRPPEVLDHRAALIDYLDSRYYHAYITNYLNDLIRKGLVVSGVTGAQFCGNLSRSLRASEAFHVQAEMMPLLRAAAMDLEADDSLVHSRLPAEHGFLMFEQPWTTTDVWGQRMSFAAVQWQHSSAQIGARVAAGIWLTYYTDMNDESDEVTQGLIRDTGVERMRTIGRWQVNHVTFLEYHRPVGPTEVVTDEEYGKWAGSGESLAGATPNTTRMVVGLFRLLNQVIVEVSDADVDRSTLRRMTKKRLPQRVQTIKLRRKARPDAETYGTGQVDWQHQWAVRGHWAWRKCRSDHPLAEEYEKGWHARIYIAPYWKGPDDRPILLTEKVWGLAQ